MAEPSKESIMESNNKSYNWRVRVTKKDALIGGILGYMMAKSDILSRYLPEGEEFYIEEDYKKIRRLSVDTALAVYLRLRDTLKNRDRCDMSQFCPQCIIYENDCELCHYAIYHHHCMNNPSSTWNKVIGSEEYQARVSTRVARMFRKLIKKMVREMPYVI